MNEPTSNPNPAWAWSDTSNGKGMSRRSFLRATTALASGLAAVAALAPLRELKNFTSVDEFLQKHYTELTPEEMTKVLKRIE